MAIDPYVLLNLQDADAVDDASVKAAYLAATRAYPPEHNPEIFQAIRAAYETIATERQRLSYQLFTLRPMAPATLMMSCLEGLAPKTVSDKYFRQLLKIKVGAGPCAGPLVGKL